MPRAKAKVRQRVSGMWSLVTFEWCHGHAVATSPMQFANLSAAADAIEVQFDRDGNGTWDTAPVIRPLDLAARYTEVFLSVTDDTTGSARTCWEWISEWHVATTSLPDRYMCRDWNY